MIVDRLKITNHFLRRWMERAWDIDTDALCKAHFGRPAKRIDDGQFIEMLRQNDCDPEAMKQEAARIIGRAPLNGQFQCGPWSVRTKNGWAITLLDVTKSRGVLR